MQWSLVEKFGFIVNHFGTHCPGRSPAAPPSRRTLAACLVVLLTGCTIFPPARDTPEPGPDQDSETYARFVAGNLTMLNRIYSRDYEPCQFVVDTESGSTVIQNLIDLEAAGRIRHSIPLAGRSPVAKADALIAYVHQRYRYIPEPQPWVPVADTIRRKAGDCKNLSLLLLSLLQASGLEAYAGISNGHMWVSALAGRRWVVLETDPGKKRNAIYRIPGFYSNPLFKIYPEYSLKRRKIERPS